MLADAGVQEAAVVVEPLHAVVADPAIKPRLLAVRGLLRPPHATGGALLLLVVEDQLRLAFDPVTRAQPVQLEELSSGDDARVAPG